MWWCARGAQQCQSRATRLQTHTPFLRVVVQIVGEGELKVVIGGECWWWEGFSIVFNVAVPFGDGDRPSVLTTVLWHHTLMQVPPMIKKLPQLLELVGKRPFEELLGC